MIEKVSELRDRLQALGKRQFVSGPQTADSIAEVERLLGTSLPPSYREFLRTYGAGFGISGIWEGKAAATNPGSLWGDVQRVRQQYSLGDNLVPVYFIPLGGACCLDLSKRDGRGECPVIKVSVPPGAEAVRVELHSTTFADFLVWHLEHLVKAYEEVAG